MVALGYTLSSEEHGPNELVDYAVRAEEVGFDFASISDHFHPWLDSQGESPFVWGTLGGVARATNDLEVGVGVTCPTIRMHPAVVAQAAATAATMFEGRFYFGVGSGEALNEHVTGEHWPDYSVRMEMLAEAVHVIRELWDGEMHNHHGEHYDVENARLYTLPDELPPIVVSAFGEHSAGAAADFGDGLWTVGPQDDLVDQYEDQGGDGQAITQLAVCYAETEDEAVETATEMWANSALPGELAQVLPTPTHFEQAAQMVSKDDIREGSIVTSPDPQDHIDAVELAYDAGFDKVYVHQVGDDQASFFEFYEDEVLPAFESV